MCGRFALTATPQDVKALFGYVERPNFPPREAIAPTEPIGVVLEQGGVRRFALMRWGFLPGWVKDPGDFPLLFNARAETLAEKAAFRAAARRRRCLVPASGFFEWRRSGEGRAMTREPFFVSRSDGRPMAMAGVWETWAGADGSEIDTVAVVTTAANGTVGAIHDRMPVIVEPADFGVWLDTMAADDGDAALRLMKPAPDDAVVVSAVARPGGAPRRPVPKPPARPKDDAQGSLF
ncbi:SOS response-associated peptidase [Alsobacter sp. R-9]